MIAIVVVGSIVGGVVVVVGVVRVVSVGVGVGVVLSMYLVGEVISLGVGGRGHLEVTVMSGRSIITSSCSTISSSSSSCSNIASSIVGSISGSSGITSIGSISGPFTPPTSSLLTPPTSLLPPLCLMGDPPQRGINMIHGRHQVTAQLLIQFVPLRKRGMRGGGKV